MPAEIRPLAPGLYLVATPIGNARDVTLRALDILASADVIAAEDTRTTRKLMDIHGIRLSDRPLIAYHDHNGPSVRPRLLEMIREGRSVAYASDAGTPLVADPGFVLTRETVAAGLPVTGAPGPSAALAALSLSGLPSDRFLFAGFLPSAAGPRRAALTELQDVPATLVLFESPKRCSRTLMEMSDILGEERQAALCRELTKKFEEVRRGSLAELAAGVSDDPPRGEVVLVVDRNRAAASAEDMEAALKEALQTMRVKDAANSVAEAFGLPKREVYQAALRLGEM
ncbi:16S rRNA (cytidine1402-2'-O)-methyltransferase [Tranquillimonas rosea]|uniref:Ribosomal RNA small subunit methyltransferase I n=1 Tax=Tranquillimonas rosea TaxID=641238 RepID=A0A1H9S9W4_9RHOB|nr:16S rRNA (cytidine(1402)-2'-O)-methyltransferase [Tranquillimonas rosea]SER81782.1 16S rRNA (cytidine1402-2'-O)-methyltransferase [Tranquillimonas rosea]